jgi:tetratricopeptide (TPR) repeat protein
MTRAHYKHVAVALSFVLLAACGDSIGAAQCEANNNGNQQTLQALNALLGREPGNVVAQLGRTRCLYFLGQYGPAAQNATEVLRRDPNQAEAYLIRARAVKMLGDISQALNDYSASIRIKPTADAHYGRALTYVREFNDRDREALEDFDAAIRLDPKYVGAYVFRAQLYSKYDRYQNALQDSAMALKLDPAIPNAYCNVGFAHYALGHDAEGRNYLNTCYEKDPDPQTRAYYETEVRRVLYARQQPRRNDGYVSEGREQTPLDRAREQDQRTYESLRNSGFEARAEACRNDTSKC